MDHMPLPSLQHRPVLLGYLFSISGATLIFAADLSVWGIAQGASSSVPFPNRIWSFELPIIIWAIAFWIFALLTAWPPFAVTWRIAKRFGIRNLAYYALCGAATGLLLTPVFVYIEPKMMWSEDIMFVEDFRRWAPTLILCGTYGALAFWYKTGRHLGRDLPGIV